MRTDRTERLLNLVLCLLGARIPVSRAAIREAVPGYGDSASSEAFERMFERDKDELRTMGVPIDTVLSSDGDVEGYRIRSDEYSMPPVAFTSAELAVLGLAAQAWSDAALGGDEQGARHKIKATNDARPQSSNTRTS
ncbi:MAG: helix-turn-helix transcriptional regulator, partial [Actinomycetota bacterium]